VYRYALLESRADWHFLLNLGLSARILDIGCGWGPVVVQLARHYEEVHGVDANELTLRFVRLRARQEGLDNLVLARVDPLEWSQLPYEDETFDLVVMNGVLEWIGAARYEESPDVYQRKALLEIRRVLKPKGLLYVGIENRFAYSSFLGAKSHSGIPFADILPRPLADLVCRMSGNSVGFRTYTYSLYGYRRIFSDCGYAVRQVLFPFPDYRFPNSIIPLSEPEFMSYWARNQLSRLYSCLLQPMILLRLAPLLAYSYAMVIEKR
jgi:SAM-dependent methyltransferase